MSVFDNDIDSGITKDALISRGFIHKWGLFEKTVKLRLLSIPQAIITYINDETKVKLVTKYGDYTETYDIKDCIDLDMLISYLEKQILSEVKYKHPYLNTDKLYFI